jgi:hypothetical protein
MLHSSTSEKGSGEVISHANGLVRSACRLTTENPEAFQRTDMAPDFFQINAQIDTAVFARNFPFMRESRML